MIIHSGIIAFLLLLTGGGSLDGRQAPRQECVTWEELQARLEAAGGRRNSSPSTFHTGLVIRATGKVASDANGVDLTATIRQMTILVGAVRERPVRLNTEH